MRSRNAGILLGLLAVFSLAAWLFLDATTFALAPADPESGRVRGCYTAVEDWFGVVEPSWIRSVELSVGTLGTVSPVLWLAARVISRFRRRPRRGGSESS